MYLFFQAGEAVVQGCFQHLQKPANKLRADHSRWLAALIKIQHSISQQKALVGARHVLLKDWHCWSGPTRAAMRRPYQEFAVLVKTYYIDD